MGGGRWREMEGDVGPLGNKEIPSVGPLDPEGPLGIETGWGDTNK